MIPTLAPWAKELRGVNAATAELLGPLLPRVDRLLEAAFGHDERAQGDPDGLDGLSRRGTPERLLLSEWGLALEAPDEFLRRAATRELLYTALAHRGVTPPPRAIVLLLDAGPGSLGAPRVAQLALVLALARRARERKAKLGIGALHAAHEGLFDEVRVAQVLRVLALRTRALPPPDAAQRWLAALGPRAVHGLWVVGAPGLDAPAPKGWSTLRITEDPEGAGTLRLDLRRDGRPLGRLELSGLDVEKATWIFSDPFRPPTEPRPAPADLAWNPGILRYVARGDYLMGQLKPGQLVAWHLREPDRFRRKSTRRLSYDEDQRLLAAGWAWRRLHAITQTPDTLTIWRTGFSPIVLSTKDLPERPVAGVQPHPLYGGVRVEVQTTREDLYFVDAAGQLWRVGLKGQLARYPDSVSAVAEDPDFGVCYLVGDELRCSKVEEWEKFVPMEPSTDVATLPPPTAGMLGGRPRYQRSDELIPGGAAVWSAGPGQVVFRQRGKAPQTVVVPPHVQVVGVSACSTLQGTVPVLVGLRAKDRTLVVVLLDGDIHPLWDLDSLPESLAISPSAAEVAWGNDADGLHFFNLCTRVHRTVRQGSFA